jgi:uncharacterized protein
MFIDLSQLEEDELHLEHRYQEQLDLPEPDVRLCSGPAVELWLRKATGREVRVKGRLNATIEVLCDRCLTPFSVPVNVSFDLLYAPVELLTPDQDVPLSSQDLDYGFYRDNLLDVDGLAQEQVYLALPFRRLCKRECRGLCQHCGTDLNKETCSCEPDPATSPWSALQDLKQKISRN